MKPKYIEQVPDGCWVACIAMITGLPHDNLIQYIPKTERNIAWEFYWRRVKRYLKDHRWMLISTGKQIPKGWSIMTGKRTDGEFHSVVAFDGKTKYDPDPAKIQIQSYKNFEILIPVLEHDKD